MGFDVENPAHDIEFRNCTSTRNRYTLSEYWNGDGFKAEDETRDIRWIDSSATDNADAGFDIKTIDAYLEGVTALRNTRNIRIWGSAVLKNIFAAESRQHGGVATEAGLWSVGMMECHHCAVKNNTIQIHAERNNREATIRFFDSILSFDSGRQGETIRREEGTRVDLIRTKVIEAAPLD